MEQPRKTSDLKEVTGELFGWEDNKVFRTLHQLTLNPGQVSEGFVAGEKQKFLSPVVYFFGVTALETTVASAIGLYDFLVKTNLENLQRSFSDPVFAKSGIDGTALTEQLSKAFTFLFSETGQKLTILPVVILVTWMLYKKYGPGLKRNAWFSLYTLGHITLITMPLMALWYVTGELLWYTTISLVIASVYWIWSTMQFYKITLGRAIALRVAMMVCVLIAMSIMQLFLALIIM